MKIRVKNFRSLKDTNRIEIRPLTILVGRNSSGKSSFLRIFPMLKQSIEERTKSPILLYGNYVDFGSYKDIKPHYSDENDKFELSFIIDVKSITTIINFYDRHYRQIISRNMDLNSQIEYGLKFEEDNKQLIHITEFKVDLPGNNIKVLLNYEKKSVLSVIVNEYTLFGLEDKISYIDNGNFIVEMFKEQTRNEFSPSISYSFLALIEEKADIIIQNYTSSKKHKDLTRSILNNTELYNDDNELLAKLKNSSSQKNWKTRIENLTTESKDFIFLKSYIAIYVFLRSYINPINVYIKSVFVNTKYIAPLRATAERYYRIQHLAVDEVDPNGKNLPIFLDSLPEAQLKDFQSWTKLNFNFITKISKIEGHYSIKIGLEDNCDINLSDMGFGYSQILPILTQIWYSSSKYESKRKRFFIDKDTPTLIVIEQPELHLHPDFQAKFADSISRVIKYSRQNSIVLNLIIETHSDIIINRLGDCILDETISSEDINIVIFNKKSEQDPTDINFSHYDKDGNLKNWPMGFFQPLN